MKIELYDRVLLKDGRKASIVEIYKTDEYFIADIDTEDGTITEDLRVEQIEKVLKQQPPVTRLVVFLYPSCTGATGRGVYGSRRISRFCADNRVWSRSSGAVRH